MNEPSKIWYVGHFFFWVITGLICYIIWKDDNKEAAKKHLIRSIWMPIIAWAAITIVPFLIIPDWSANHFLEP